MTLYPRPLLTVYMIVSQMSFSHLELLFLGVISESAIASCFVLYFSHCAILAKSFIASEIQ